MTKKLIGLAILILCVLGEDIYLTGLHRTTLSQWSELFHGIASVWLWIITVLILIGIFLLIALAGILGQKKDKSKAPKVSGTLTLNINKSTGSTASGAGTPANPPVGPPDPPKPPTKQSTVPQWEVNPSSRSLLGIGMAVFYSILITIGAFVHKAHPDGIWWWVIALAVGAGHFGVSFKVLELDEWGIVTLLGPVVEVARRKMVFVPYPCKLEIYTTHQIQVEFGTVDPETIQRAQRSTESDNWYVYQEPVRIIWGDLKTYQGTLTDEERESFRNDPLAETLTTDPHLYFRLEICDPVALKQKMGDLDTAIEQIKDLCTSVISEIAGRTFIALAKTQVAEISDTLRILVENLVADPQAVDRGDAKREDSWGINILAVRIKDIGTPRRVNEALANKGKAVIEAQERAETQVIEATAAEESAPANRRAAVIKAEANKEVTRLGSEAELIVAENAAKASTAEINAKIKAIQANQAVGTLILHLDAAAKVMEKAKVVVVPGGGNLLSEAMSLVETLKATDKT